MITWITTNIALCEFLDIIEVSLEDLEKEGFTIVLNIREKNDKREEEKFKDSRIRYIYSSVPVELLPNQELDMSIFFKGLELSYQKLCEILKDKKEKVLIHCTGGIDRSPYVVARYLVEKMGCWYDHGSGDSILFRDMRDAYRFIKKKRPFVVEHLEWETRMCLLK